MNMGDQPSAALTSAGFASARPIGGRTKGERTAGAEDATAPAVLVETRSVRRLRVVVVKALRQDRVGIALEAPLRRQRVEVGQLAHGLADNLLPPGWTEAFTPEGKPYYFNSESGETRWERPAPPSNDDNLSERSAELKKGAMVVAAKPVIPGVAGLAKLPRGWRMITDKDGTVTLQQKDEQWSIAERDGFAAKFEPTSCGCLKFNEHPRKSYPSAVQHLLAVAQDDDAISVADRREAMRDDERRAAARKLVERLRARLRLGARRGRLGQAKPQSTGPRCSRDEQGRHARIASRTGRRSRRQPVSSRRTGTRRRAVRTG